MARSTVTAVVILILASSWALWSQKPTDESLDIPNGTDPALVTDPEVLDQALSCPAIVPDAKGVVLLVHGTGMTPQINWDSTLLQPLLHEGFQPFYLEVPHRLFRDTQITAEYISYAVKKLVQSHEAAADGISIISWSAGGLATQWTLTFFPETRSQVKRHISIGPSYRGSWTMMPLFYLNLYSETVVQQLPWSQFLATLAKFGGGRAHVPTTNIGSSTDQMVQPGFYGGGWANLRDAWRLQGPLARNIDLFKVCASKALENRRLPRVFTHDSLLWEPASHKIIMDALNNEETYLGDAESIAWEDCQGSLAPHLEPESENLRAAILPALFTYARTQPKRGWPEVAVRDYAK